MVKIRGQKDKDAMDFEKDMAKAETMRGGRADELSMKYIQSLGRSVYTIIDPEVVKLLTTEDLEYLIPLFSHLNRMTQITKEDVYIARLDIEAIFLRMRICTKEKEHTVERAHLLDTLEFFARHIPTDSFEGFKAKLLAYVVKVLRTELEEKKTKGLIG